MVKVVEQVTQGQDGVAFLPTVDAKTRPKDTRGVGIRLRPTRVLVLARLRPPVLIQDHKIVAEKDPRLDRQGRLLAIRPCRPDQARLEAKTVRRGV